MLPGDELIVVFDNSRDAGDTPRNRVLDKASGTHILFLDDDDAFKSGALEKVRAFARANPAKIGIFRLDLGPAGTVWREESRTLMATATAMYVVPNVPGRVGRFGRVPGAPPGRLGDFPFIVETVALQGEPVWCEEVIQELRPEKSGLKRLRYAVRLRTRLRRAVGIDVSLPQAERSYPEAEEWARQRHLELRSTLEAPGGPSSHVPETDMPG
jgi:hypothetical protein